ncbi:hypothetical protein ABE096_21565 [Robertmurraya massiliosenegalensis]|uniref:hypothetical protein n=1 Tax=Robertmurraya TaxID=2837507 RepID=UPI0039A6E066
MRLCAYCKEPKQLTKEHVFPSALIELFPESKYVYFGQDKIIELGTEKHVVKDVCQVCNNERLQELDSIGTNFIKEYFLSKIHPNTNLTVEYDFMALSKWVMKIIYNSNRQFKKAAHPWFEENSKFIVGLNSESSLKYSLFLAFFVDLAPISGMYPDKPFEVIMNPTCVLSEKLAPPFDMFLIPQEEFHYLLQIGNAIFLLIVWNEATSVDEKINLEEEIQEKFPYSVLSPGNVAAVIARGSDCINCGNMFLIHGRKRQLAADLFQKTGFKVNFK